MIRKKLVITAIILLIFPHQTAAINQQLSDFLKLNQQAIQLRQQQHLIQVQQHNVAQQLVRADQQLNRNQQLFQQHKQFNHTLVKIFACITITSIILISCDIIRKEWKRYCWQKKRSAQFQRNQCKQTQDKRNNTKADGNF